VWIVNMLYIIGLGLGDVKDITVKGLELVRKCDKVYLEHYTSILTVGHQELEKFYEREIILADRELVEQGADQFLDEAKEAEVGFLVVGDPFGATTHSDLVLRAKEKEVQVQVVHNASIMSAIGCCGLQLYNFGETVSIPFWTENWKPDSFHAKILDNLRRGQHTLCLLDIKVKEQSEENLARGRKIFEPPRFMSCQVACQQLMEIVARLSSAPEPDTASEPLLSGSSDVVCLARVGTDTQALVTASLAEAADIDLGPPLHSLVIPGSCHFLEQEALNMWRRPK